MANLILWNSYDGSDLTSHPFVRPLGCHQIANWLSNFGYTVKVIDFCSILTPDQVIHLTEKNIDKDTIAIGLSTTFTKKVIPTWAEFAKNYIENRYTKIKWILGGRKELVSVTEYDWINFIDKDENAVLKFLDENTSRQISRKEYDIASDNKHLVGNLGITKHEVLPIELSRGCQFSCRFCSYPHIGKNKGTYIRKSNNIEEIFLKNYYEYGTTRYAFMDDTCNENETKITDLAKIAQRLPFELEWVGYNRLDLIGRKPYTANILKDSGLRSTFFGIESFNKESSALVGKGWNGKYAKDFLLELKDIWGDRINWMLGFIIGLGHETIKEIIETDMWCVDNDMYSWDYSALHISENKDKKYKSEFELNYEKYGYRFTSHSWHNRYWDTTKSINFQKEMNENAKSRNRISTFRLMELGGAGYDFNFLIGMKLNEFNISEYNHKVKNLVDEYFKYQINL